MASPEILQEQRAALHSRVESDFAYHPVTRHSVADNHDAVRNLLCGTAHELIERTPVGRAQSLMLTALEEAMHWANSAIAKSQYSEGEAHDA